MAGTGRAWPEGRSEALSRRRRVGAWALQEEPRIQKLAIYPDRPMQVAARRVACRVLGTNELSGRDLRAYVDACRRLAGHVGIPGDQTRGVGEDHEPCPRRRVVRVIAHENHHARPRRVDRRVARGRQVNALMEVTTAANSRLRSDARAPELLGHQAAYGPMQLTAVLRRDAAAATLLGDQTVDLVCQVVESLTVLSNGRVQRGLVVGQLRVCSPLLCELFLQLLPERRQIRLSLEQLGVLIVQLLLLSPNLICDLLVRRVGVVNGLAEVGQNLLVLPDLVGDRLVCLG